MRVTPGTRAYRRLAAAVLLFAVHEARGSGSEARQARGWLTSPSSAADRALWLAWLDVDEATLQRRLAHVLARPAAALSA